MFSVLQVLSSILRLQLFGVHPAVGLFAENMSLAVGHGTAIAWGGEVSASGRPEAEVLGNTFATFARVAGE